MVGRCGCRTEPLKILSEEVNRKCPARNTMVQLSTPYTDSEWHNTLRHRQTDIQPDRQTTLSCQQLIILCATVWSAYQSVTTCC